MILFGKSSGDKKLKGIKFLSLKAFKLMTEETKVEIVGYTDLKKYGSKDINELIIGDKKLKLKSEKKQKGHCIGYIKTDENKFIEIDINKRLKWWYGFLILLSPMTVTATTVVIVTSISAVVISENTWLASNKKEETEATITENRLSVNNDLPYDDNAGEKKLDVSSFASYVSAGITYNKENNSIINSIIGNSSYNILDCYFKLIINGKECFSLKDSKDIKILKPNQYVESFKLTSKPDSMKFDKAIVRYYAEYDGKEYYLTDIEVKVNIED